MLNTDKYVTAEAASDAVGVSVVTIRRWVKDGKLRYVGEVGRSKLLDIDAVRRVDAERRAIRLYDESEPSA